MATGGNRKKPQIDLEDIKEDISNDVKNEIMPEFLREIKKHESSINDKIAKTETKVIINVISIFGIFASVITFLVATIIKSSQAQHNWKIMLIGSAVSLGVSIFLFCWSFRQNYKSKN